MNEQRIRIIKYLLLSLNIIAVIFISTVIKSSTSLICIFSHSLEFLSNAQAISTDPMRDYLSVIALSILLIIGFLMRQFILLGNTKRRNLSILVDAIIVLIIIYIQDFNYNGIILWVIANIVYYNDISRKYIALGFGIAAYIFTNYGLLSIYYPLYSVVQYFLYFPPLLQKICFIFYYTLSAFNLILFIIFCVIVIQEQKGKVLEINELNDKLSEANKELQKLATIKEKMGETKERNRIAREIHDTIGHSLMAISVGVDASLTIIDHNPQAAKKQLMAVSAAAQEGIADVRRSVSTLRPDTPGAHRLNQQLSHLVDKTVSTTGIEINFDCIDKINAEEDEENAIFRVVQECITNSIKHGKATKIDINIKMENSNLLILIKDNGVGCKHLVSGFGMMHMRERISMLQGELEYFSDNGFTVSVSIPMRKESLNG
jgi:signal transduction histidine kinase